MRLVKMVNSFIPTFHNTPCRIAIFEEDGKIKVYEKVYFRSGKVDGWFRCITLERLGTVRKVLNRIAKIERSADGRI